VVGPPFGASKLSGAKKEVVPRVGFFPIVLDMTAAAQIGYVPVGDYATTVVDEIDWLVRQVGKIARIGKIGEAGEVGKIGEARASAAHSGDDGVRLPVGLDEEFFDGYFDYAREDRYLADHRGAGDVRRSGS